MKIKILLLILWFAATAWGQHTHILPTPQQVEAKDGVFLWNEENIQYQLVNHLDVPRNEDQAYRLRITKNRVIAEATTETGLFYARQSLNQLHRYATLTSNNDKAEIPCLDILDWPDFKLRGWQDDISRGPIVSMEYLKRLIPQLAECKINFFSLYTEHTFRTESHPDIAPIHAFTAEEIRELDNFCKQYHIQLIGNQQCFAHFEEILKNPFYEPLADAADNLNPSVEDTYELLDDIISEEAQVYSSSLFNINCDETESLGSGKAKAYVDSIGKETAYYRHINRVNEIVKRHGKRAMMWGDIADQHPEILENLDKDIIFLAWSYAARESFDDFLQPYVDSGHDFMVAPGLSMSGWVWPHYQDFCSDIPHLCRDGFRKGAFGVMNTCWDDFGESLINSGLYGLALGAEMSWNPIKETNPNKADEEEALRNIKKNFSIHFFGSVTDEPCRVLEQVSALSDSHEIGRFSTMTEPMIPFFPSQVGETVEKQNQELLTQWFDSLDIERQLKQAQSQARWNKDVFDNALYAVHRIHWCTKRNITRCQLYKTYLNPDKDNKAESRQQVDGLITSLHQLKREYIKVWEQESRPYWLEVNMGKYDDIARALLDLPFLPFLESSTDEQGQASVILRTIYNDQPIHYALDGKAATITDPVYKRPIALTHSNTVKATCYDAMGRTISNERYFLYHKGMGKLKSLNSPAGNYRPEYSGGGDNALLDGHLGSNDYKDGHWQGFYGIDADIELDLKQKEQLQEIEIGFLVNAHDWILKANQIEIYVSADGSHYRLLKRHDIQTEVNTSGNFIFREHIPMEGASTRYLRVVVKNPGLIPEGLPGYGYDSWIFMDELILK